MGEMADLILKAAEQARRLTALEAENAELKADNRLLRDELSAAEAERDEARLVARVYHSRPSGHFGNLPEIVELYIEWLQPSVTPEEEASFDKLWSGRVKR